MSRASGSLLLKTRAVFRLARTGVHIAYGIAVLGLVYPRCSEPLQAWLRQRWSRQLLAMLGLATAIRGQPLASMRVANHVSWIDIFVIMANSPAVFVSKADVKEWPVIGRLVAGAGTIFMQRNSRRAALAAAELLASKLVARQDIVAFPEGTSTDGSAVLPFHGALLQGAIQAKQAIQPLALRYVDARGARTAIPAYYADISLLASLWSIASASGLSAELTYLSPRPVLGVDRKILAEQLRADVVAELLPEVAEAVPAAQWSESCRPDRLGVTAVALPV